MSADLFLSEELVPTQRSIDAHYSPVRP